MDFLLKVKKTEGMICKIEKVKEGGERTRWPLPDRKVEVKILFFSNSYHFHFLIFLLHSKILTF